MAQLWTIAAIADNAVLAASFPTPSAGSHPKDNGWRWDAATQKATRIDTAPDLSNQVWSGTAWIENVAKVEADLVLGVKQEAERRKMLVRSPGSGKSAEYRAKRLEATTAASLSATALNLLDTLTRAQQVAQYPYAATEAVLTGDKLTVVLKRYIAASNAAEAENARLASIEWNAVAKIKAASTGATKRAAWAAINWSWQPV